MATSLVGSTSSIERADMQYLAPEMHVSVQSLTHFAAPLTMAIIRATPPDTQRFHLLAPTINLQGLQDDGVPIRLGNNDDDNNYLPMAAPPVLPPKHIV